MNHTPLTIYDRYPSLISHNQSIDIEKVRIQYGFRFYFAITSIILRSVERTQCKPFLRLKRNFSFAINKSSQELNQNGEKAESELIACNKAEMDYYQIISQQIFFFHFSFLLSFIFSQPQKKKAFRGNRYLPNIMKNNRKFPPTKKKRQQQTSSQTMWLAVFSFFLLFFLSHFSQIE